MSNIENFDIRKHVVDTIVETFDSLVSMEIEVSDSEPPDSTGAGYMLAAVNFAGNIIGFINIQVTSKLAKMMTANMLDIEPAEVEDNGEIKNVLAEISNIVGGNLKSALNDAGHVCDNSKPAITDGADAPNKPSHMDRFERYVFSYREDRFFVEVGLKTQPAAADEDDFSSSAAVGKPEHFDSESASRPAAAQIVDPLPAAPRAQEAPPLSPASTESKSFEDLDLDLLLEIPLEIKVELGRARIQIQELLKLAPGSAVKLVRLEGEPVDILANDTLIARGEVVVHKQKYGIRITEITNRIDRIRSFSI